jgi:hypothetical protein
VFIAVGRSTTDPDNTTGVDMPPHRRLPQDPAVDPTGHQDRSMRRPLFGAVASRSPHSEHAPGLPAL